MSDYPNSSDPKLETSERDECVIATLVCAALFAVIAWLWLSTPCK